MRRAFQRCSASLPQAIASQHSSLFANRCLRLNRISTRTPSQILLRSIHQSPVFRQQVEAAAEQSNADAAIDDAAAPITKFAELEKRGIVHPNVIRTITGLGLETMTEVQTATINEAIKGTDIIAQAKTGTGKTIAFLLPVLQNILTADPDLARRHASRRPKRTTADDIRALIISPTRELAEQIAEEAKKLTSNTSLIIQTAVGGTQKRAGLAAIQRQGCHILVGTPGRLKDILSDEYSRVEAPDLSALVFDEADRLLDQGFWPEIQEIMRLLPTPAEKDRQTLMFSATVPKEVVGLVRNTLKPGFQFVRCVNENEEPTHARVPQKAVIARGLENTLPALAELCGREIEKADKGDARPFKAIVYFSSTAEVALATGALQNLQPTSGVQTDAFGGRSTHVWPKTKIFEIHSKLSQSQRTRAADVFRRAESAILLSSDVTARGMDFPNVTHVIQMGLPSSREQYIHRIGRTARAGKEGEGWLILNSMEKDEMRYRLSKLPIKRDETLETASVDMSQEAQVSPFAGQVLAMVQAAMQRVSRIDKNKVYQALLGVYGWLPRKNVLVESMNDLALYGWGMKEPPAVAPGLARKLRIDRVPGIRLGEPETEERGAGGFGAGRGGDRYGGDRESSFGGRSSGGSFGERNYGDRNDKRSSYGGGRSSDNNYTSRGRSSDRGSFGSSRRDGNDFGGRGGDRGASSDPFSGGQRRERQQRDSIF